MNENTRELGLYAVNTAGLYAMRRAIEKNLARKVKLGVYDAEKAVGAWEHFATAAAKEYHREHGTPAVPWHRMFPRSVRRALARVLSESWEA